MRAVVVAAGDLDPRDAAVASDAEILVAADGGAASLDGLGLRPTVLVGDLDSVDPVLARRLAAEGTRTEPASADKDETDTELAVAAALASGADELVVLGALGGLRLDHALANVLLLADESLAGRRIRLVQGPLRARVVRGGERVVLEGRRGDLVSLLPLAGTARGVVTEGLRYPLDGEALRFGRSRGVSNEVVGDAASVTLELGMLLVVEIAAEASNDR